MITAKPFMLLKLIFTFFCHRIPPSHRPDSGFALPMAMILGMVMIAVGGASVLVAQSDRDTAVQRRESGASVLVSDSAIARAMVQLSIPNNGVLLARNYDPIDPTTGKNYLGSDSIPNNGDETATAVDQWTGYDPSSLPCYQQLGWGAPNLSLTGTIGTSGTYTIRSYRYDKQKQQGTALVEGIYHGQSSRVAVTISIEPELKDFPGILLIQPIGGWNAGLLALRGRQILGSKGNVYYSYSSSDSSLTGSSSPSDTNRLSYLNAIYSSNVQDGAQGDTVAGKIFACRLTPWIPSGVQGTNLGVITTSQTLTGSGGTVPTVYQVEEINLDNNETLTVDTTGGPVYINLIINTNSGRGITLRNNAKILNIRTDGKTPRVGDFRLMARDDIMVTLYDRTCIQNAFLWSWMDEVRLLTSGPGCPGGQNTNIEGVVWAEAILNSKQANSNRNVDYLGFTNQAYDVTTQAGVTSGIAVPNDVTSLVDLLEYVDWPVKYKYGAIKNWQRVD